MKKRRIIEELLDELNISAKYLGYRYWVVAIDYTIDPSDNISILYEEIANYFNTKSRNVERTMRTLVSKNQKHIRAYFKVGYKLTNKEVLALLVKETNHRYLNLREEKLC